MTPTSPTRTNAGMRTDLEQSGRHLLAGTGTTYGHAEPDDRERAHLLIRRLANRHQCTAPAAVSALVCLALGAGPVASAALWPAAVALLKPGSMCERPARHASDVTDALMALRVLGLVEDACPQVHRDFRGRKIRTATCPVCRRTKKIGRTGNLHKHDRGDGTPCPGGGKRPAEGSAA
ncbi:hypothetical protein [Actinomadura rugatobispora]|uniref:Uncharacterized protein n=1 Tax=Actinomadura rugatobispora TaxID=1994 RepID=A0ABW0ZND4_9ACTN|nr:hypothetical protein GCM10010200_036060 [Actinomadura rugatobispora]